MSKYTNLTNEIETTEPNYERTNNIIIGIAVGMMIVFGAIILAIMYVNN